MSPILQSLQFAARPGDNYPKGIKLTPEQLSQISVYRHSVLPQWNYTLLPNQSRN